ncbi:sulfatase-like hydrolase/transferase [Polyangium spumosum]|uniref:Sulfatase-like hydrolase/transferase n=1 Tax=Polyangium spumosum TaxID=889282 RepID=A0A6N7PMI5_9BACT|nr:sulfatase-like hydrolase/transferase [Polyangium spumosum]MRG92026.1 sulfatase-like hydrolase/transferase [Polyangium spumosum]
MTKTGWTMRLGEACVLALAVAAFSAVPTALRTSGAGGSLLDGLLVGTAALLPLVTLSIVLLRAAGRGLRGVIGAGAGPTAALGIALWIGLALPALAVLAGLLKALTHHRGLGGATFGVLGAFVVVACALVARRMVEAGQALVARGVRPVYVAAGGAVVSVVPLLVVAAWLYRASGGAGASSVSAALVDLAIAVLATALVASIELGDKLRKLSSAFGVPFAAVLMIAASARLESSPALGRAVQAGGGLAASLLSALERWTDRDGDGMGAHFGGGDCDEGDPRRHPGAEDVPGDGIDQDCSGADTPRAEAPPKAAAAPGSAQPPASASAVPASTASAGKTLDPSRPDILLITLDTVRADHTSVYGYDQKTTPHLEALAARGVVFEHAYATGSDTQRALVPLVSGKPLSQTPHNRREWPTLSDEIDSIAERMKRAGYTTAAVASFTWLSEDRGFSQGFDRFEPVHRDEHPERSVTGALATRAALSVLEDLGKKDAPIFLWIHLFDAHERYLQHEGLRFGRGQEGLYDGEIAFVDKQIGQIAAFVSKWSRASRVAWVVHGSHGEAFDEHGEKGHGAELYDEMIRVPFVVVLPGGRPGRYGERAVSTLDVAPTVLALGDAPREGVSGVSLLPHARLEPDAPRRPPVLAYASKRLALIDWPLKLMVIERKKQNRNFLFDLGADPRETKDLSADRPDDVARLLKLASEITPP